MAKLRSDRAAWVEHCRQWGQAKTGAPSGPISFGPPGLDYPHVRAQQLGVPLVPAQMSGAEPEGITLTVRCPFCLQVHTHILDPETLPARLDVPAPAPCAWGSYRFYLSA